MDKVLELAYSMFKEENYKGIFKIIVGIFILFAPSLSIILVYKRNIFNSLEFTKLLLVCIVMNVIILIITTCITIIFRGYKYLIYICNSYDNLEKNNSEFENIYKEKSITSKYNEKVFKIERNIYAIIATDVVYNMFYVSILPWINFYINYMYKKRINLDIKFFLLELLFVMFGYGFIHLINSIKKTRSYDFRKKYFLYNIIFETFILIVLIATILFMIN